ncbi:zinc finger FYVE domain-containing protein 16 [Eublepharis macularius]|uniref:Zinc finger FYVE domain-containing protein n=1 Tax=Eublepharis macularius TaxID=481883 RepID=A0AA97JTT2_EUBMA|nr:zinc finger FYVE domain-containing protein 16 [Eublepharis macularius]
MDSYFKAAVSDLDKLLDEFEQNTDEPEDNRVVNPCDSKQCLLPSELNSQQQRFLEPNVEEYSCTATTSDELSLAVQTTNLASFEQLNFEQNEKNVTGLDLLSMVDGGSSEKSQSSCLGLCSIPVCDLISDTGSLSHVKSNSECIQRLQPGDFQNSRNSLIGFDLALVPATACNLSVDSSAYSYTQQQTDSDPVVCSKDYNATKNLNQLVQKTDSKAEENVVDSVTLERTETSNDNEVFDQLEPITTLDRTSALMTQPVSNAHSSKDDTLCEKLPCELLVDKNTYCAKSQMILRASGKQAILDDDKIESVASNLPKICDLNKNSLVLSDASLPTEHILVLDKTPSTEEKLCSPGQDTHQVLNIVSTPEVSEDLQTSLSCLPLAVSICGSLVTSEDSNGQMAQDDTADVISDITMHIEKHKTGLPKWELYERRDASKQEENLNTANQLGPEKPFIEKEKLENTGSKFDLPHQEDFAATFSCSLDAIMETSSSVLPADADERASVDLGIEEDITGSDMLVSDAELDAFLSEHCLQSSNLKLLKDDTADEVLDVVQNNLIEANKPYSKSDCLQTETEFKKVEAAASANCTVSNPESKMGILAEKSALQVHKQMSDHVNETGMGVSDLLNNQQTVHSGGARPKQLLNLPPKAKSCSELSSPNVLGSEPQVINAAVPNTSLSDAGICTDSSFSCVNTQNCLEGQGENVSLDSAQGQGENVSLDSAQVVEQPIVLGQKQPSWVPDSEAPNCMNCQVKFTFTRRRHHCRACGKVFCGPCCNRKCKLQYMDKEARVCISCYESINKAQAFERMMSPTAPNSNSGISENCSTVQPPQESQASGVCPKEQRRVWFADGILPNGEVADTTKLSSGVRRCPQDLHPVESPANYVACTSELRPKDEMHVITRTESACHPSSEDIAYSTEGQAEQLCNSDSLIPPAAEFPSKGIVVEPSKSSVPLAANEPNDVPVNPLDYRMLCGIENCVSKEISLIPEDNGLPPLLLASGGKGQQSLVEEHTSYKQIALLLEESNLLTFILNANLLVNVKIVSYGSERCWYFSTNGLHGLGQAEIIILLLCLPEEKDLPKEIFRLLISIYKDAMKGKFIGNMENITFTEGFLESKEHGGFLFVTPTFQKLDDLALPKNPFLCGILIHKQEVPWAKVFPIRLMLRLGAEYSAYPTPLTSIRHRKPLFGEIGHTVMNLLVDLRNYQYTLHTIDNLFIHMEMGRSCIKIPLNRYNEVMKVMNTSNEHVISIGASFSSDADSHLVCMQNSDGVYQTQANSATGQPRKVTGASFVVFNGALKTSSGFLAKSSIVEDGLMVQITPETMEGLRQALREKRDFKITCGKVDSGDLREYVDICWVQKEEKTNMRITSPIDGKSMEGAQSEKIVQEGDFEMDGKLVKCTEVFYLVKTGELNSHPHQFAKEIALACCAALCHHLKTLKSNGMNKIGLRVSMDTDMVEYQAGSGGQLLPQHYLNDLDSALIPVIHGGTSNTTNLPLEIELLFFITESLLI